jgi:hypothetical protein
MSKCTAICKNGTPCPNDAKMNTYCCIHYNIYEEKSLLSYDVVLKMPFPLDVSIKILNLAGTKIKIEDRIKFDIPPSKLVINPIFAFKMNKILKKKTRPPTLLQQMAQQMEEMVEQMVQLRRENEELRTIYRALY